MTITINRQELYELVWSMPMRKLALEYGISDVGLAKICKKHRIPRPGRGYWAKLQNGQRPRMKALPKAKDAEREMFDLPVHRKGGVFTASGPMPIDVEICATLSLLQELRAADSSVPDADGTRHPLVERTAASLRAAAADHTGLARPRTKKAMDVRVAPASINRAALILDEVLVRAEQLGIRVHVGERGRGNRPRHCTMLEVHGETVEFRLFEATVRKGREAAPGPFDDILRRGPRTEYSYSPCGRLSLHIETYSHGTRRRSWADGERQRVEGCVWKFLEAALWVADDLKDRRRREEAQAGAQRAFEAERQAKLGLIQAERKRMEELHADSARWRQARELRDYIAAVQQAGVMPDLEAWVAWATHHADRMDPLAESPASVLDEAKRWERRHF